MLPLIPLALSLLPDLGRWIAGDTGGRVASAAADVVRAVAGTDDPAEAQRAVEALPPAEAAELRIRLAEIARAAEQDARAAELEALRATLADTQNARGQTVELARAGSQVQWAPVLVSAIVLTAFALMAAAILFKAVPPENREAAMLMLGSLSTFAGAAVTYWLGSSAGSAAKNALLMKPEGTR
jgi:hypothetical protein